MDKGFDSQGIDELLNEEKLNQMSKKTHEIERKIKEEESVFLIKRHT